MSNRMAPTATTSTTTEVRHAAALFARVFLASLLAVAVAAAAAVAFSPTLQAEVLVSLGATPPCAVGQGATTCVVGDGAAVVTHATVRTVAAVVAALLAGVWIALEK